MKLSELTQSNNSKRVKLSQLKSSEGFLQKAIKEVGNRATSFAVGGPTMASIGGRSIPNAEDYAVPATQFISDIAMDNPLAKLAVPALNIPGVQPSITTGLTSLAETGRQGIKSLKGQGFNPSEIGKTAGVTMGTELAGRGIGKFFMGNAAEREAMNKMGQQIGSIKNALREIGQDNPNFSIAKEAILDPLEENLSKVSNPRGKSASVLRQWRRILNDPNKSVVSSDELIQMEDQLGKSAKFTGWKPLDELIGHFTSDKYTDEAAKATRKVASDYVNDAAANAGHPEFEGLSRNFSKTANKLSNAKKSIFDVLRSLSEIPGLAIGFHQFGGDPLIGAGIGLADLIRTSPLAQKVIYNAIGKSGIGAGATTGISEVIRRNSN